MKLDYEELLSNSAFNFNLRRYTEVHIMANVPLSQRDALLYEGGLDPDALQCISLVHHIGQGLIDSARHVIKRTLNPRLLR